MCLPEPGLSAEVFKLADNQFPQDGGSSGLGVGVRATSDIPKDTMVAVLTADRVLRPATLHPGSEIEFYSYSIPLYYY